MMSVVVVVVVQKSRRNSLLKRKKKSSASMKLKTLGIKVVDDTFKVSNTRTLCKHCAVIYITVDLPNFSAFLSVA